MSICTSLTIKVEKNVKQLITTLKEQYSFDETSPFVKIDDEKLTVSFVEAYCFSQNDFPHIFETIAIGINPGAYNAEATIELSTDGSRQDYQVEFKKGKLSVKISDYYSVEYIDEVDYEEFCEEHDLDKKQLPKKTFNKLKKQGEVYLAQSGMVTDSVLYIEEQTCKVQSTGRIQKRESVSLISKQNDYGDGLRHNGDFGYGFAPDSKKKLTIFTVDNEGLCSNLVIPETLDGLKVTGIYFPDKDTKFYQRVTIPSTLTYIILGRGNFNSFEVDKNSKYFTSDGYALYTKDMKTLLYMNNNEIEEYAIPDGVEKVDYFGARYEMKIRKLVIPDSVKEFYGGFKCPNLEIVEGNLDKLKSTYGGLTGLENTPYGKIKFPK